MIPRKKKSKKKSFERLVDFYHLCCLLNNLYSVSIKYRHNLTTRITSIDKVFFVLCVQDVLYVICYQKLDNFFGVSFCGNKVLLRSLHELFCSFYRFMFLTYNSCKNFSFELRYSLDSKMECFIRMSLKNLLRLSNNDGFVIQFK